MTPVERANQRNAVLAGFLGWTLDAFDFFILTLVIDDIAKSFGRCGRSARSSSASWPTTGAGGFR
jgi:hypothetical protein